MKCFMNSEWFLQLQHAVALTWKVKQEGWLTKRVTNILQNGCIVNGNVNVFWDFKDFLSILALKSRLRVNFVRPWKKHLTKQSHHKLFSSCSGAVFILPSTVSKVKNELSISVLTLELVGWLVGTSLTFEPRINKCYQNCHFHSCKILSIGAILSTTEAEILVHGFITSRLLWWLLQCTLLWPFHDNI